MTMTTSKSTIHPADAIHEGVKALKGVNELIDSITDKNLHLVQPENLSYMLLLIERRLQEGLEAVDPQEKRFG